MNKQVLTGLALMMALSSIGCASQPTASTSTTSTASAATEAEGVKNVSIVEEFKNPANQNKPLTRWWIPGSQMNKDEIEKEIKSMADAGFGGAEIVPVSVEGGDGDGQIDWGSDQWKEITKYILETAGKYDFTIDFTLTPAWPLALPTIKDVNDPKQGAQMELDGAWVDGITADHPLNGKLPVSQEAQDDAKKVEGEVKLIAVSAAPYLDKENKVLDYSSAKALDLDTVKENEDGTWSIDFTPEDDREYVLYAWYQHPSGNTKYGNNQVDHYSAAGTQMIIDYWEDELIPYYGDGWKNVRSLFVDSLEFETHLDWTYDLNKGFQEKYGYDIMPYLAAVYDSSDEMSAIGNYMGDPVNTFTFNENTEQIKNDFREYLTELYIQNNIVPLQEFCQANGVSLRYQTSYGKSLNLLETAMYPDIPETESLYGNDYMDFYRLQAGAVHAQDKPIYSMETAAEWTETWNDKKEDGNYGTRGNGENNSGNYEQTFADHLWHDQRAFASGVNQVVFHGYPYNGQYEQGTVAGTQWPGFTGFESYRWSNSWGERQPNWMFAKDYTDFISRNQMILRQGTPKVDLAVYHHSYYETIDFWGPDKVLDTTDLEQNGYSYDFIDPSILSLDNMQVEENRLDLEGAAYKALIFNNEDMIPYETAKKVKELAENGLTIVFVNSIPENKAFVQDEEVEDLIDEILKLDTVIEVDDLDSLADALKEHQIIPDADYSDETLLTNHRQDETADYYYFYNYGDAHNYKEIQTADIVDCEIELTGEGTPYLMDAWTGETTPIADYTEEDGKVTVNLEIAPNDSKIIALSSEELAPAAEATDPMAGEVKMDNWSLTVESWTKGETVLDIEKTQIEIGELEELKSWNQIEGLETVSGVGVYTTEFEMPSDYKEGQEAYIHCGFIKDAYGVTINDKDIEIDPISGLANVTDFVKPGKNTIKMIVATSMLNAILKENSSILNEEGRVLDDRSPAAYGLVNDVVINGSSSLK